MWFFWSRTKHCIAEDENSDSPGVYLPSYRCMLTIYTCFIWCEDIGQGFTHVRQVLYSLLHLYSLLINANTGVQILCQQSQVGAVPRPMPLLCRTDAYFILLESSDLVFQVLEYPVLFTEDAQLDLWVRTSWRGLGKGVRTWRMASAVRAERAETMEALEEAAQVQVRRWPRSQPVNGNSHQCRSRRSSWASDFDP